MKKDVIIENAQSAGNMVMAIARLYGLARELGAEDQAQAIMRDCGIEVEIEVLSDGKD